MTLAEFKAWLEGFEHSFAYETAYETAADSGGQLIANASRRVPSGPQWEMIKAKLALVDVKPVFIPQVNAAPTGQKANDWYRQQLYNDQAQSQQARGAGLGDLAKKAV